MHHLVALIGSVDIALSLVTRHPDNTAGAVVAVDLATAAVGESNERILEGVALPVSGLYSAGAADIERVAVYMDG